MGEKSQIRRASDWAVRLVLPVAVLGVVMAVFLGELAGVTLVALIRGEATRPLLDPKEPLQVEDHGAVPVRAKRAGEVNDAAAAFLEIEQPEQIVDVRAVGRECYRRPPRGCQVVNPATGRNPVSIELAFHLEFNVLLRQQRLLS